MRFETYRFFEDNINAAYGLQQQDQNFTRIPSLNTTITKRDIRECISQFISLPACFGNDTDLFELGFDSLILIKVRRSLSGRSPYHCQPLPSSFFYEFPTVDKVAATINRHAPQLAHESLVSSSVKEIVGRFSCIPRLNEAVVLLLGCTGSLGSHVLVELVEASHVRRVICLVRKHGRHPMQYYYDSLARNHVALDERLADKVQVLEANTAEASFGLSSETYEALLKVVTHVLNCAWSVNFNLKTLSFMSHYQTVHNLLTFLSRSAGALRHTCPKLVFISSVAVIKQCARYHGSGPVTEAAVSWEDVNSDFGYAQAKRVCELILQGAAESQLPFQVVIARVGQISGSSKTGFWSTSEHIRALLKLSEEIGTLPRLSGVSQAIVLIIRGAY